MPRDSPGMEPREGAEANRAVPHMLGGVKTLSSCDAMLMENRITSRTALNGHWIVTLVRSRMSFNSFSG